MKNYNCALYVDGNVIDTRSIEAFNKDDARGQYAEQLDKDGINYDDHPEDIVVSIEIT